MLVLAAPGAAAANSTRHTTPAATATEGECSVALPCRIDHAINGAAYGDEVIVASGVYQVATPLDATAIDLHGEAGKAAPLLIGASTLAGTLLEFKEGGSVRHLSLRSTAPSADALTLQDGSAEDLTIVAVQGDGAKVMTGLTTSVLRDSVVVAEGDASGLAALKLREGSPAGSLAVRNVIALAPARNAIRCEVAVPSQATVVNVVARGFESDIDSSDSGNGCSATHSNLRPEKSPATLLGAGIQSAEPLLGADHRPLPISPTIDAGTADGFTSAEDPDGRARTTPDIGAFECCGDAAWPPLEVPDPGLEPTVTPTPTPTRPPTPTPTPVAETPVPELARTIVIAPGTGSIKVKVPGARGFEPMTDASALPVGTVVDARRGRIRLTSALDEAGTVQRGTFWGGRFKVGQSGGERGMVSLVLRGGSFDRCPQRRGARASRAPLAGVSRVPGENSTRRRVVRSLWARDRGGRFRTHGNNSVATARGTAWVTRDRCDGTVTRVTEGAVLVRERSTGRRKLVRAGGSYLAPAR